jgi:uncharacterized protein YggU (UPF0235/DUF167 family)
MYVKVRVTAGAKRETVAIIGENHFEISVKEKAERNRANIRVIEIIAREFTISRGKVRIVAGHHSPSKIINVEELI